MRQMVSKVYPARITVKGSEVKANVLRNTLAKGWMIENRAHADDFEAAGFRIVLHYRSAESR